MTLQGTDFAYLRSTQPRIITPVSEDDILEERIAQFRQRQPQSSVTIEAADYAAIEMIASLEYRMQQDFNGRIRGVLPAFMSGDTLDHVGALFLVNRRQGESDASYFERILLEPIARATIGTVGRIRSDAYKADDDVRDVQVAGKANGQDADVWILSHETPAMGEPRRDTHQPLLCSASAITSTTRIASLLFSTYTVEQPTITAFTITATLNYNSLFHDATSVLTRARERINEYVEGRFKLGFGVRIQGIEATLYGPDDDVEMVTVTAPSSDLAATNGTAYHCNPNTTDITLDCDAI